MTTAQLIDLVKYYGLMLISAFGIWKGFIETLKYFSDKAKAKSDAEIQKAKLKVEEHKLSIMDLKSLKELLELVGQMENDIDKLKYTSESGDKNLEVIRKDLLQVKESVHNLMLYVFKKL